MTFWTYHSRSQYSSTRTVTVNVSLPLDITFTLAVRQSMEMLKYEGQMQLLAERFEEAKALTDEIVGSWRRPRFVLQAVFTAVVARRL